MAAAFAIWYAPVIAWTERGALPQTVALSGYLALGGGIWFGLTGLSLAFMIVLGILIPQMFMLLPMRWAVPQAVALNSLVLIRLSLVAPMAAAGWAVTSLAMLVISIAFARFITGIIRQSAERKALIVELQSTRRELAEAEHSAAVLQERQRLAQEIHDTLAQGFTSILMHLEAAGLHPEAAADHLHQAKAAARASLNDTRSVIQGLYAEVTPESSLRDALWHLVSVWSLHHKIPAELTVTGNLLSVPAPVIHAVQRIAQEALANARKHASPRRVDVTLSYLGDALALDVHDDGVGFTPGVPAAGFGLRTMRDRAQAVGGALAIESAPGEGTTIALVVPLGGSDG